jgi:hypothetical protein
VAEFKVQGTNFDASAGFMSGGTLTMVLRSGTNDLHGQVYYFHQNPVFQANRFFFNKVGQERDDFLIHRWGGSVGGPIRLGKLYDGRNKTFFMYGYEGVDSFDPGSVYVDAVPTIAQRNGDFSALLALGKQYQIYDPLTAKLLPNGRIERSPLPNNIIPASRINPIAKSVVALYDLPNLPGQPNGDDNYQKSKNMKAAYYNHALRIDHILTNRQRLSGRGYITVMDRPENERHNNALGYRFLRANRAFGVDHVYTISPKFIVDSRYSFTRFVTGADGYNVGWDLEALGFSSNFVNQINSTDPRALRLPTFTPDGYVELGSYGETPGRTHPNIHDAALSATSLVRSHMLRYGVGYRVYQENRESFGYASGRFTFGTNWTRGPYDTSSSAPLGQGLASFMMGLPTGGYFPIRSSYAEQATIIPLFIQDDWKITRKLTLSFGLRYERHAALTERFDRTVRGFDFNASSPIEAEAVANYAKSPMPELPSSQFTVKGGLTFSGANGEPRPLWETNHCFMPRMALAYSITPKTVLRAGYGIFYAPLGAVYMDVNQTGFARDTNYIASLDNGLTFIGSLENPFPNGFLQPLGADGGLATNMGQSVSYYPEALANPQAQRWNLALQRELPFQSVLEVSYVGNRGTRTRISRQYNPIPAAYLSTSGARDQATIDYLAQRFPNPFYPMLPGTSLASTTVTRSQLARPYPQFTGISGDVNQGYSWYHSMQVRFEKRFSRGFFSSVSYTWSKLMEARQFLNETDPMPYESISDQDRTHRFVVNWIYEIPFGRGRAIGKNWGGFLDALFGGWQIQGIGAVQSGSPLDFGNIIFNGDFDAIKLSGSERTVDRWFNVDAGFERSSSKQLASNIRTFPLRLGGVRSDIQNNWDLSLIKNAKLWEGVRLQFRAEGLNALNHAQHLAPNTTPTSSSFGAVTSEWSYPRVVQFGLKILF